MGSILPGAWGDCRAVPFELSLEKTVGAHRGGRHQSTLGNGRKDRCIVIWVLGALIGPG